MIDKLRILRYNKGLNSFKSMKTLLILLGLLLMVYQSYSQNFEIKSPDRNLKVQIKNSNKISWSVTLNKKTVVRNSEIAMDFSIGSDFGIDSNVKDYSIETFSSIILPIVPHKSLRQR